MNRDEALGAYDDVLNELREKRGRAAGLHQQRDHAAARKVAADAQAEAARKIAALRADQRGR